MKDTNSMSDKEIVLQKVWKLFNVLRNDLNTDDYTVVLPFIYFRSENLIAQQLQNEPQPKQELIQILKNAENETIQKVFDVFIPSIERLSEKSLNHIIDLLYSINHQWLKQNIAVIYDETLERIALSHGRLWGEFIQPKQLTDFLSAYVGSTKGLKVFNPFAGVASFMKNSQESHLVFGQEINLKTWAIGKLRLIVHQISADFICEDSIMNWPKKEKFDLIISNPPFGMRIIGNNKKHNPNFRDTDEFSLKMGLNSLSSSGKLISVLPQGILFKGGYLQRLRERLIEEDLIDAIISFPGGILNYTGIPFIVLVLNKAKKRARKIRLIVANDCVSSPSPRENIIEVEKLIQVSQQSENTDSIRIISNEDVIANDFNLNISRYFQDEIDGVKLKDFLTYFRVKREYLPKNGKIIRIRDLKDDKIDFELNIQEIEELPINRSGINKIDISCLLLAVKWKTLKPTYFQFDNQPIFNGSDILPFIVDDSKVDTRYLINELHSDYVQKQINSFRQGTTIPFIKRDDLLEVRVKLPSIEEQRAKVEWLLEISEKIKQLQNERNALAHGVSTKEFNEFASLKHTLGRPRQNILGWSKNLSKFFFQQKDSISVFNDEFKALFDLGIIDAINEINRDIKFISEVLEKGENGLMLNDYEKEIVPLLEINSIIDSLSSNEFKFSIKKQLLKVDEMKTRGILINKVLFRTLLDNLLTNANKYGFKDNSKGNHVMLELIEIDDHLIVDIRNNGLPFPKNFDREKFIKKYSTAETSNGSGLGGYDINRIATYFENENWDLVLKADPIYPVIFYFSFPIKLSK